MASVAQDAPHGEVCAKGHPTNMTLLWDTSCLHHTLADSKCLRTPAAGFGPGLSLLHPSRYPRFNLPHVAGATTCPLETREIPGPLCSCQEMECTWWSPKLGISRVGSHSPDLIPSPARLALGPRQAGGWAGKAVTQVQTGAGDILRVSRTLGAASSPVAVSP